MQFIISQFSRPSDIALYTVRNYCTCVFLFSEIVAACASVFVGYRVVAAFGSLCVAAGFLAASFVDPSEEIELMNFLVGFLGGMIEIMSLYA